MPLHTVAHQLQFSLPFHTVPAAAGYPIPQYRSGKKPGVRWFWCKNSYTGPADPRNPMPFYAVPAHLQNIYTYPNSSSAAGLVPPSCSRWDRRELQAGRPGRTFWRLGWCSGRVGVSAQSISQTGKVLRSNHEMLRMSGRVGVSAQSTSQTRKVLRSNHQRVFAKILSQRL